MIDAEAKAWTEKAKVDLGRGKERASMSTGSLPLWIVAFKEELVDTGQVAPKFHDDLLEAYRLHQMAQRGEPISREVAEAMLKKAHGFVAMAEEFVEGGRRQD
jgi:hypothetical protein